MSTAGSGRTAPAALRGVQLLGAVLLFYLLDGAFGSGANGTVGGLEVLLAPVAAAVVVINGCGPRPWITRLHWRPTPLQLGILSLVFFVVFAIEAGETVLAPRLLGGDQFATTLCAARDLLQGHDPYQTGEPQCLASLGISGDAALTPLRARPFDPQQYPSQAEILAAEKADVAQHSSSGFPYLGYPPLSFLTIIPFAGLGFTAVNLWVATLCLVTLLIVARRAGREAIVVTAGVAAGLGWCLKQFGGDPEILGACALIIAVAYLDRPLLSGSMLAAACCTNELAWIAVAPYFVVVLRLPGLRWRLTSFFGVGLCVIGLWTLYDPRFPMEEWRFVTQPVYPVGVLGLFVSMTHYSPLVFDGAFAALYAASLLVAARRQDWSWAVLASSWILLWVSWRSLMYYYLPLLWLSPVVALALEREHRRRMVAVPTLELTPGRDGVILALQE
ncbi:MAG TPA: hypothetical protein VEK76_06030 [Candidatus Binatia bacterium]|nr:hypothetical protein [Candidatus Binatia bacterium]